MKEFSNVFDERGERRICSDSAEPEKQRMQFNVYFLGIGGIGMSALARYFLHEGRRVAGYDRVRSHLTDQIEAEGAVVHYEEDPALIPVDFRDPATTIVVYTPAVPADHAELRWFRQNGFEIVKRSQMLGYLSQGKFVIAVAGTHGKTTTTTLVAWLNHRVTGGGSAFLGGISRNFSSNLVLGRGRRLAVEADEFDRSFLRLWPDVAVVSSADADHLDIYGTHEALREAFSQFVGQIREGGALVVKQGVDLKIGNPGIRVYRYSYDEPCDFYARNVTLLEGGHYRYDLVTPGGVIEGCTLGIPGWVNIENAVAAVAALWCASERDGEPLDAERLREALASFEGVKRRFEFYVNTPRQVYMDDYAHHPTELAATLATAKEMGYDRVIAVHQPFTFSRTKMLMDEFAKVLSAADQVVLLPIMGGREKDDGTVKSEDLAAKLPGSVVVDGLEGAANWVKQNAKKGDLVVCMSCGDLYKAADMMVEK